MASGERTLSFLTSAFATEVFPEAEAPAMPITWRVNQGGLYSNFSLIIDIARVKEFMVMIIDVFTGARVPHGVTVDPIAAHKSL